MNISDVNNDGIGLDGLDPVSYHNGEPIQGTQDYRLTIEDITYLFSSEENMERFEANPGKYLPIAGGHNTRIDNNQNNRATSEKGYVGNKQFTRPAGMEDAIVSNENNIPMDIKEDGSMEMQNLSDSDN